MAARIYRPGCQVDNMILLEGEQGIGKSSALRAIGGDWFAEQHESATGKDFFDVLQGKMLVEISEMDAFNRAEVTRVKQVVTCTNDRFRESYARRAEDHPRQCVFVGTTNRDDWNRDETGARRFWPIACQRAADVEAIKAERSQLFAEAVARFKAGESWWDMPAEDTQAQQAARYDEPAWTSVIERYLETEPFGCTEDRIQRRTPLTEVTLAEILELALKLPVSQWTRNAEKEVGKSLRALGFYKKDTKRNGKVGKRWFKQETGLPSSE
jgi:putative DNA primase/helicase